MKRLLISALLAFASVEIAPAMELSVTNPTADAWVEAPVVTQDTEIIRELLKPQFISSEVPTLGSGGFATAVLKSSRQIIPIQFVDLDRDDQADEALILPSLHPGMTEVFAWPAMKAGTPPADQRSHAGMYIPGFEGPGWESDLLAFRLYWDERNATDIFCKRTAVMGLHEYAKPEVNYHQDTPWGMDVLKVGTALGAGGFGIWHGDKVEKVSQATRDFEVLADGPLEAVMDLKYTDWKVADRLFDLTVRIRAIAGQRFAEYELWLVPKDGGAMPELVVGIVKHEETMLIQDQAAGIVGRWGKQALGPGEVPKSANLGLGVTTNPAHIAALGEDEVNSFIRIKPQKQAAPIGMSGNGGYARYRAHASWEHEPAGAQSVAEYEEMLRKTARLQPIVKLLVKDQ